MLRFKHIILLLLIAVSLPSYGRSYGNLAINEGLSDLLVSVMYKDSSGFLWIGTGVGLDRYDGASLKNFSAAETETGRIFSIVEYPENKILAGGNNGLYILDKGKETLEPFLDETIHGKVYSLLYEENTLYIGTDSGLYVYRDGMLVRPLSDHDVFSASDDVRDMCVADGCLWLATDAGLCSLNLPDRKYERYHNVTQQKHHCLFTELECIGRRIFLATNDRGLIAFDLDTKEFSSFVDVGSNVVSSLSYDGNGILYVGTDGNGIHKIDVSRGEVVDSVVQDSNNASSLLSNSVYSILVDRDGLLWIGYYQHGLSYTLHQNDLFTVYSNPLYVDTHGMAVRSITIRDDEMVVGSRDGFFFLDVENGRFRKFQVPELRTNMIFCSLYHRGEYYIGTYGGGMHVLDPETLKLRDFASEDATFFKGQINCIKEDTDGNLWVGTSTGVYCYDDGLRVFFFNAFNSKLPSDYIHEIFFDSTGKGWICTGGGISIWDPAEKTIRVDCFPEKFDKNAAVRMIYEDSEHRLYFGPEKGQMFSSDLNMTDIRVLNEDIKEIRFITEDNDNWLLIGTNNGLYRFDKKSTLIPYGFVDGIPDPNFNFCPPVKDDSQNIWMGNTEGLLCMSQSRLTGHHDDPYSLSITDVHMHGKASVTFCFSDFSYTAQSSMMFEYRLDGKDQNWHVLNGKAQVTYYDLGPGKYVFRVRKIGRPETEVSYQIKISDLYLGGVLAILLIIGTMFFVYKWYVSERKTTAVVEIVEQSEESAESGEKYKTNRLSSEECRKIADNLEKYMRKEKPYTSPDLKIADLASAINTSSHSLSFVFNQYLNSSFYDYINEYRVREFCSIVNTEAYSKYTLTALAELCGFSSRASFFRSFKKVKGVTPSEFVHNEHII